MPIELIEQKLDFLRLINNIINSIINSIFWFLHICKNCTYLVMVYLQTKFESLLGREK